MKILIVGASSFIGLHLLERLKKKYNCIGTYFKNKRSEELIHLNILSKDELDKIMSAHKPNIVLWVAGSKDLKLCEQDEKYAYSINTQPIIDYINLLYKQKIIFISTNYVFDGVVGNYRDCDKPKPQNVYGKTNYLAEQALLKSNINYNIIRSSAVIGKGGVFYDWLMDSLRNNLRISMFDSYFTPTPIQLFIDGIDFMISKDQDNKITHVCGEIKYNRYDFAKTIQKKMYNNNAEIIKVNSDNSFLQNDLSLTQSNLCSSFQRFSSLEYIEREKKLYD